MARKKNIAAGLDAVIYARYSSHNQREVSIEQQVAECTKHAAALGLRIVGTYEDRAISGKTDNRPRFQQMMRDAEKGKFQAVVAWKSNRIGRNMLQAMVNEAKLDDYGVKVFYAEEDFDDTAAGRFALRNMMNVNQFYSENMAEDITRGLYDNANKCMANGRQPLGYKRGADGKVMLDEPAAAVVREIFTRVAAGDLFVDIARDLNAKGIKTSKGAAWNKGSFQSICQNERYKGIYIYGDVRIVDGIPRIVSDELWYRVQEAMRMKKNPVGTRHRVGAEDYLLTGKLHCGHCGSYMTGVSGTSRNGELHYYYTCQKRRTEHACNKKNVRRDVIEPAIAQAIKMYCLTDDVIEWMADQTVQYWEKHDNDLQIEALEQQLTENKKATSNMLKAIEMGIITEATRSRMVELETENSKLTAQLSAAKRDVVKINREDLIDELHVLRSKDIQDREVQAELFKDFLVAAYIYDDNRLKLVFSFMGKDNSVEIPLETGEDPPDSPDAKMFVLTPDCSTKKALYFAGSMVLFFLLKPILGLHCFACMSFGLFAENRDVPADKRVPITKETAVQQAAVRRSLLLFSVPRDGHSALCFLYEPCSRPSAGGSQNGTAQNIRRVMDTEVHPRECDENAYRQSRHRPLLFPGHPKGCHRGEGRRRMARRKGEIVRVRDKQLYLRKDAAWTDAGHQRLEKKIAEDSVDEERRCQHTSDPPRFTEHQQHRCQRHPENTGVSQTGNKTHASIQHGAVQGLQELQESEFGVHKAPSFSFRYVQDTRSL